MLTARKRLVFDELLRIQLLLVARKRQLELATQGISHDFEGALFDKLVESLPLSQRMPKAIAEIPKDFSPLCIASFKGTWGRGKRS